MNKTMNDVVVVLIEIFRKSLNYKGDFAQNSISVLFYFFY